MANLQVKRVPDDLYAAAQERAAAEGLTLSDFVLRNLRRELALPSKSEWLRSVEAHHPRTPIKVDIEALMDEVRDEFER